MCWCRGLGARHLMEVSMVDHRWVKERLLGAGALLCMLVNFVGFFVIC